MLPGTAPNYETVLDLNTGNAIIAGGGFDSWSFRYGFDISIPVYSPIAAKIDSSQPEEKKYLYSQRNRTYRMITCRHYKT
ncbi:hypothetical protein MSG28_009870 [Choristoneura fumiferana]|uniref:Uncharacterized protein n=1 Tax=Choristoneura fumiferana TaxID=7141 RepID=A0ACC0JCZ3_CHOFU|nr:hypothetical protein MSG28_009870 [Choristoneura fumiferana]